MIHQFHPEARDEFAATVDFYEGAVPGLGRRFRDAVAATMARLDAFPASGTLTTAGFRRAMVSGFPYDIIYSAGPDVIQVLALAHQRRKPGYWRSRAPGR